MASFSAARSPLLRAARAAPASISQRRQSCRRLSGTARPKLAWLDLRGAYLSAIERLAIEELLLRHDPLNRSWGIVGVHEPTESRLLKVPLPPHDDWSAQRKRATDRAADVYGHAAEGLNRSCAIILGIGGKPERLIDVKAAKDDGAFTVVVDHSSLWTTFVGRSEDLPDVKPFPREIMRWSAEAIFGPAFESWDGEMAASSAEKGGTSSDKGQQTLVFQGKSCGFSGGVGESLVLSPKRTALQQPSHEEPARPSFELRENDYVFGRRKFGGNAQCIASGGFLHHTSFLWDWDDANMGYLALPDKRPDYRGDRSHDEFLVRLKDHYGERSTKNALFGHVKDAAGGIFEVEDVALDEVLQIADEKFGGLQAWFDGKCRTRVVKTVEAEEML
ncbi:hypothetical protein ACHAXT_005029 [Thalassiosira profunda]